MKLKVISIEKTLREGRYNITLEDVQKGKTKLRIENTKTYYPINKLCNVKITYKEEGEPTSIRREFKCHSISSKYLKRKPFYTFLLEESNANTFGKSEDDTVTVKADLFLLNYNPDINSIFYLEIMELEDKVKMDKQKRDKNNEKNN